MHPEVVAYQPCVNDDPSSATTICPVPSNVTPSPPPGNPIDTPRVNPLAASYAPWLRPVRPVDQQRRRRQLTERPDTGKTAWEDVTAEMEDLRRETEVQRSDLMALENARLDQYAGIGLIAGGVLLATLWADTPVAESLTFTPLRGGGSLGASFGF